MCVCHGGVNNDTMESPTLMVIVMDFIMTGQNCGSEREKKIISPRRECRNGILWKLDEDLVELVFEIR